MSKLDTVSFDFLIEICEGAENSAELLKTMIADNPANNFNNESDRIKSISNDYEGTECGVLSKYYMGKIYYEMGNFNQAKLYLNDFLDNTKEAVLVCGAIKQLVDISFQEKDFLFQFIFFNIQLFDFLFVNNNHLLKSYYIIL